MKKIKYFYNTNSLRYEKLETPLRVKLLRVLGFLSAAIVTAIIIVSVAYRYFPSANEKRLSHQNEGLKENFLVLEDRTKKLQQQMIELEDRDNEVYRTIFEAKPIPDSARLVREEQFGPILPIIRFSETDAVIEQANGTEYGLAGSVWSGDRDVAYGLARRMDSGTIWINKHLDFGPNIPFAGAKESGIGVEWGEEGLHEFTQIQIINEAR